MRFILLKKLFFYSNLPIVISEASKLLLYIKNIFYNFIWGDMNNHSQLHWVSWQKLCYPWADRGLEVRRLGL